jgi:hypothetical protein
MFKVVRIWETQSKCLIKPRRTHRAGDPRLTGVYVVMLFTSNELCVNYVNDLTSRHRFPLLKGNFQDKNTNTS